MPNLLVIKPSSLGDIIHGLQVIQSVKNQCPDLHVTWIVREIFVPIVEVANCVDDVFVFERNGGIIAFMRLIKGIRQKKYDWVFDMQGLARSALITFFSKANLKVGRSDARECASFAYNKKISFDKSKKHALDILLQFLPTVGLELKIDQGPLFNDSKLKLSIDVGVFEGLRPIIFFPNSRRREKEWPYFSELTDALLAEFTDESIIWVGQKNIKEKRYWPEERFFNLIGKTNIHDVVALIKMAKCIVTNDSGPMHIAAAYNKKIIGLFGPTKVHKFGPYPVDSSNNMILKAPGKRLERLSVESVIESIRAMLTLDKPDIELYEKNHESIVENRL